MGTFLLHVTGEKGGPIMHTLVKTAAAIHNLSLATAFGGPLYARTALYPTVIKDISDERQRGRVLADAWKKYNKLNVPAHVAFTATWLIERHAILALPVDHRTKKLVHLKSLFITGALVTGIANVVVGNAFRRDYPEGAPVKGDGTTSDPRLARYHRFFQVSGPANLFFVGASLAIGPFIGGAIVHSLKRHFLLRMIEK
jgi:hypothetical protein